MTLFLAWLWGFNVKQQDQVRDKNVLEKSDALFLQQNYQQVLEILKELQFDVNVDVLWRLSRVLYKLSEKENEESQRMKYIKDAYNFLNKAVKIKEDDANVHKWLAIIISAMAKNWSTGEKIKNLERRKAHLMRSLELNPDDYSTLYMLGNSCFAISSLSNFQRTLIRYLFAEPPTSSYKEAYGYFLKAEELRGKFYIPNLYMLGKACYLMNHNYKARYYFDLAASLTPHNYFEKRCQEEAKEMINKLDMFNLSGAVFNDFAS